MGLFGFFNKKKKQPSFEPSERRLIPRWKINTAAKISWDKGVTFVACDITDLNLKGFGLTLTKNLPDILSELVISVHERFVFHADVSVIWHKEKGGRQAYGVKFTRIRDVDKEKIYQMICQDFPDQFEQQLK